MANPNIKARLEKLERTNPKLDWVARLSDVELEAAITGLQTIIDDETSRRPTNWPEVAQAMAVHGAPFSQAQFDALCRDLSTNLEGVSA